VILAFEKKPIEGLDEQNKIITQLKKKFERKPEKKDTPSLNHSISFIEHSKSSRGKCKKCDIKIERDELRVAKPTPVELDDGRKFTSNQYFHLDCYVQNSENPRFLLEELIKKSQDKNSIAEDDIDLIKGQFSDLLSGDSSLNELLNLLGTDALPLKKLKQLAKEKGVNFTLVEKAIERGLLQGIYFKPTPDTIQKLI
jgi:hypothetical protein